MKILETHTRHILAFGLLILTWVMIGVFLIYTNAYQSIYDRSLSLTNSAEEQHQQIQLLQKKCGTFYCYTGDEFINLYETFITSRNQHAHQNTSITGNLFVDEYLRNIAEERGYIKRMSVDPSLLVEYNNLLILPEVRNAYLNLRNKASEEGISIHLVSAFRTFEDQRKLFISQLSVADIELIPTGIYDDEINRVLSVTALPGYSKHHEGHTLDFACGDDYLVFEFKDTDCYTWMSQNNYEVIKRFGFIPSYPQDVEKQGPSPEAWEYVYIDREMMR